MLAKQLSDICKADVSGLYFSRASFALQTRKRESQTEQTVSDIQCQTTQSIQCAVAAETQIISQKLASAFAADSLPAWEMSAGCAGHELTADCQGHDLVILSGSLNVDDIQDKLGTAPTSIAIETGKPICVVPTKCRLDGSFDRPLLAWNNNRATFKAIQDALPLLVQAQEVTVCSQRVNNRYAKEQSASLRHLTDYLSMHHVCYRVAENVNKESTFADQLMYQARCAESDLVVLGAYAHNNVRELIVGSTARAVIEQAIQPVFISY